MQLKMESGGLLRKRIHESIGETSNVLSRVAIAIAQKSENIGQLTITDISNISKCGESSIVRYCRTLGFSGFRDFKIALAAEVERDKGQRLTEHFASEDTNIEREFAYVCSAFQQSLAASTRLLDHSQMMGLAQRMRQAKQVEVFGMGVSRLCADILAYRLVWLGISIHSTISLMVSQGIIHTFDNSSLALGISYSGSGNEAYEFLKAAREKGAYTVAITAHQNTLITKAADEVIMLSPDGPWPEKGSARLVPAIVLFSECLAHCLEQL